MFRVLRGLSFLIAAGLIAGVLAKPAFAQARSAKIKLEITKAGFILGVSAGGGTLYYRGRRYPLTVGGASLGLTVGVSRAYLSGTVYNLRRIGDIAGTYGAVQAGATVVEGHKATELKNANGVVLRLTGHQEGVEISLDVGGLYLSLK